MAVKIKRIVLWRGDVENVPGSLARTLAPLKATSLQTVMGYHRHGEGNRAVIEAFPVSGKRAAAAAASVGLAPSTLPALLVEGDDRAGLGYDIAQALGAAGINMNFLVAQVVQKRFAAVFGFVSDADAKAAVPIVKKASAAKAPIKKALKKARNAKKR
jgi:hypothetical protein